MIIEKVENKTTVKANSKTSRYAGRKMSREEFLAWKKPINSWNYEFNQGIIETEKRMKNSERYIIDNLIWSYNKTNSYKVGNSLFSETDCWLTTSQMRRPDVAYFTADQIKAAALGQEPVPAFVAEVISTFDAANHIEKKLKEYFAAGVQVVWHIYPELQQVKIYTSLRNVKIGYETDICPASPAISDLQISVDELFKV